ncbi:MAG: sensor histidine kinase, partial [Ktedonobacterales bacterium]
DGAGDLGLRRRRVDLAALCRREAQLLPSVKGRVLRLRLPRRRVEVEGDRDAVGRVITNLLSNADKYSPVDRPIALSLRADGQGQAHVTVRDQGPGIPKAERQRIWEQFHRVPGVEGREMAGGLGLGLAICRGIIEQLGARSASRVRSVWAPPSGLRCRLRRELMERQHSDVPCERGTISARYESRSWVVVSSRSLNTALG